MMLKVLMRAKTIKKNLCTLFEHHSKYYFKFFMFVVKRKLPCGSFRFTLSVLWCQEKSDMTTAGLASGGFSLPCSDIRSCQKNNWGAHQGDPILNKTNDRYIQHFGTSLGLIARLRASCG